MSSTEGDWIEQSTYDLETARAMLTSGRYLYVLFCCQQAVEKTLKALIVHRTGEFPPASTACRGSRKPAAWRPIPPGWMPLPNSRLSTSRPATRGKLGQWELRFPARLPRRRLHLTEELITWLQSLLK